MINDACRYLQSQHQTFLIGKYRNYKNVFLKRNQATTCSAWFGQSGKERSNSRQYDAKKLPQAICRELLLGPWYDFGNQSVGAGKIASINVSSLASWIALKYFRLEASQEIKVKLNENRRPKFYKVKQLKENSTPEFCWKDNFKEDSIEINLKLKGTH